MKGRDISDALSGVDESFVTESKPRVRRRVRWEWIATAAAVLLVAVFGGYFGVKALLNNNKRTAAADPTLPPAAIVTNAPTVVPVESPAAYFAPRTYALASHPETPSAEGGAYYAYLNALSENGVMGAGRELAGFYGKITREFLLSKGEEQNAVCSPMSMYMALAMLAEITDGETRAEILNALGVSGIEALRGQYQRIYEASYRNSADIAMTLPAASIWLNEAEIYNADALGRLAEIYRASVFGGRMGDPEYDAMIKKWLDDNTGGLLKDMTGDAAKTEPSDVMKILSTLYFKASWTEKFTERLENSVFHSPAGDQTVDFIKGKAEYIVGREGYTLVGKQLSDGSVMWFALPDEGVALTDVMNDPMAYLMSGAFNKFEHSEQSLLTMPEIDISFENSLTEAIKSIGITTCFDYGRADFSPISGESGLAVSKATHGARLIADIDGVEGAAFTRIDVNYGGYPFAPREIVLDRPFMFLVMSADSTPLFVGTAYDFAD